MPQGASSRKRRWRWREDEDTKPTRKQIEPPVMLGNQNSPSQDMKRPLNGGNEETRKTRASHTQAVKDKTRRTGKAMPLKDTQALNSASISSILGKTQSHLLMEVGRF